MRKKKDAPEAGPSAEEVVRKQIEDARGHLARLAGGLESTVTLARDLIEIRRLRVWLDSLKSQMPAGAAA